MITPEIKIEYVPINDLILADYNPRTLSEMEYEKLKDSLEEEGFIDPVIVNKHPERMNIIIGGHQRVRVARDLGYETVPVHYVERDLAGEMKLNLRLNKTGGKFDYEMLANNFDSGMLFDVGFTENELGLNIPTDNFNKSELGDAVDTYLEGTIKQIVLFFKGTDKAEKNDFGDVVARLDTIMTALGKENHTDTFLAILEEYENNRTEKKG